MPQLLWCFCTLHLSPSRSSPRYYQASTEKDPNLKERTVMSVGYIVLLLELCLKNTYFSFQGQFYEQVEGMAMVSQASSSVANSTWSTLSKKLQVVPATLRLWHRYVDDTFVIQKEVNKQNFLQHINRVDPAMQLAVEDNKEDGAIPSWIPL